MTIPRFFLPADSFKHDQVFFPPELSRQIRQVLRLNVGDTVQVLDNSGAEYSAELTLATNREAIARITATQYPQVEAFLQLEVWVCASRREKMEWILQKCTEIGVSGFRFLISERSLIRNVADVQSKQERWQQIITEAAEQSGRVSLPIMHDAQTLPQAVAQKLAPETLRLLAWEEEQEQKLAQVLPAGTQKAVVMIGPEGGFTTAEARLAFQNGFRPFTMGKRLLRVETAALVAAALILHQAE